MGVKSLDVHKVSSSPIFVRIFLSLTEDGLTVSVCNDCARHAGLEQTIEADINVRICRFYHRSKVKAQASDNCKPVLRPFKALIRFCWDEFEGNSHWGGRKAAAIAYTLIETAKLNVVDLQA